MTRAALVGRHGVLARFGLLRYFTRGVGADMSARAKPDPAPVRLVLKLLDALSTDALFCGDSHLDARCAQASAVGIEWHGGGDGGDEVLQHPVALRFQPFTDLVPPAAG